MKLEPHIEALIAELELDPNVVRSVRITPAKVVVEVYLRNELGKKYVRADGEPAIETLTFKHRAYREVEA